MVGRRLPERFVLYLSTYGSTPLPAPGQEKPPPPPPPVRPDRRFPQAKSCGNARFRAPESLQARCSRFLVAKSCSKRSKMLVEIFGPREPVEGRGAIPDRMGRLWVMATFRDLLSAAKAEITEVDTADAAERIAAGAARARRPRARRVRPGRPPRRRPHPPRPPRGPGRGPARSTSRRRSSCTAPAACARRSPPRRCRSSATPTSCRWPAASASGRTRAGRGRRRSSLTPEQTQPLPAPPAAARGRRRRPGQAARLARCCCSAPAASARPPRCTSPRPASARSASSTWTRSTPPTCSARSCTTSTASATARSTRRRRRSTLLNPDVDVVTYDTRLDRPTNIIDIITGYDVIVDGADNFPQPLPAQRRQREARHPGGARLDLPLRGHGQRVPPDSRARRTATWCPSRRPPSWPRAAPRPACSACCPASSASIQALETIKVLLGLGEPLIGRILRSTRPT